MRKFVFLLFVVCGLSLLVFRKESAPPKIYDCFSYNELELLEVRLKEMSPHVDKFVIVEACETFRGLPKPFTFAENRERFAAFADQIVYVPLTGHLKTDDPWTRERYQRAQVLRGLKQCSKNDLILLSDVDEIVRGALVPKIAGLISSGEAQAVVCQQNMYFGYLNRYWAKWRGTVCARYGDAKRIGIKKLRRLRNVRPRLLRKTGMTNVHILPEAGWHFTSMGGQTRYAAKLEAYSHSEADTPENKSAEGFLQRVRTFSLHPIDASFPVCIRENTHYYQGIGLIESETAL